MSHHALYAIRDAGMVQLHHSRWGALSIAADAFFGPDAAKEFAAELPEASGWMNDIFCEGAFSLDVASRRAVVYSTQLDDHVRPLYSQLVAASWRLHGWQAHLAEQLAEVAENVGVPGSEVTAPPEAPLELSPSDLGRNYFSRTHSRLMVGGFVGWGPLGRAPDVERIVDLTLPAVLMAGPECQKDLRRMPTVAQAQRARGFWYRLRRCREGLRAWPVEQDAYQACLIHAQHKQLIVFAALEDYVAHEPVLPGRWPGWRVEFRAGDLIDYMWATGREANAAMEAGRLHRHQLVQPVQASFEECVEDLRRTLLGADDQKRAWHAQREELAAKYEKRNAWVAPDFSDEVPAATDSPEMGAAYFDSLVAAYFDSLVVELTPEQS